MSENRMEAAGAAAGQARPGHALVLTRRALLASGCASALVVGWSPAQAQSSGALQDWLGANAIPIRTAEPRDEDFRDLEPLITAIGDARIVQLGEPSHNAGTCFAAKARLVKFLHRRLGFDVVVWESGFYDVERTEAALRAAEDAAAAAQRGILRNWSGSEDVRPLFEYAKESHAGAHPLVMAGFDMSNTGPFAPLAEELRAFTGGLTDPALRDEATEAAEQVIDAFAALSAYVEAEGERERNLTGVAGEARREAVARWEREVGAALRPRRDSLDRLQDGVSRLTALFQNHPEDFAAVDGPRRSGFMARIVASLGGRGATLYESDGVDVPDDPNLAVGQQNRRDALNADNLRWLIEEGYPGKKIIVWAHNAHVMNAYYLAPDFRDVSPEPAANAMKPHGVFLKEWYGPDVYTIGFTAYEGEDGWTGLFAEPIVAASEDSIEARLHSLGLDYAFLDLRAARGVAGHPMRAPQTVRVPKYDEVTIDPTRPYDALFFIARMEPATLIA